MASDHGIDAAEYLALDDVTGTTGCVRGENTDSMLPGERSPGRSA